MIAFTLNEWAAFGMGAGFMLVLVILAAALLLWHWGRTLPPEFRGKPPEHQNCRCVPTEVRPDKLREEMEARDRMMRGKWENTPAAIESAIFVFDPVRGNENDPAWRGSRRKLIDYKAALRMLCAHNVTEHSVTQVQKLADIVSGKVPYVSVAGGMLERPLKMGESSASRPLPPAGRDGGSPLRNHPELAEDPSYVRQCIGNAMQAEDFAARTGRIPELFEFRTGPESRGRLLTRKNAERMAGQHFPERAAADIVASLARGATSSINVGVGTITRFEPVKAS